MTCVSSAPRNTAALYNTGPSCVSDCSGLPPGNYQSCVGCKVYATCTGGYLIDNRPCPAYTVWDDESKTCEATSTTCSEGSISTTKKPLLTTVRTKAPTDNPTTFEPTTKKASTEPATTYQSTTKPTTKPTNK